VGGALGCMLGCTRRAEPPQLRPDPSASALARPSAVASAPQFGDGLSPPTRLYGNLAGGFTLRRTSVTAGEPVVVDLELRSTRGPLVIYVGGDQRNAAGYPTRMAVKATTTFRGVVCDSVAKPELANFGGLGGERTLREGEPYRESFVLNPACGALGVPGDYTITLHRRVTDTKMVTVLPGSKDLTSCDLYPVHAGELPAGYPAACAKLMETRPSATAELQLHVAAFDAAALRRESEARLREAALATPADEIGRARLTTWLCGWVACGCPKASPSGEVTDADVLGALPKRLPPKFPKMCGP
jgi:hypothetical protein